ncbi:MAG: glycosyltransferase [Elusimicrobia bacterium]|nr:glycosyltransferase [Elusimicrobiota bacterium]
MTKIKVAFFIDKIITDMGGTEKQLLEMVRRLDRGAFEPYMIFLSETPWMRRNSLPCEHTVLGFDGFLKASLPRALARFRNLLREKRFDIMQTFFNEAAVFCWMGSWFAKAPALLSSRRDMGLGKSLPWYHALYRGLMPAVNRRFDGIVINGKEIKNHVMRAEGARETKVKVIHNGIELPSGMPAAPRLFREKPAEFWVAVTANLKPVKRIDFFLRALALLRDEHNVTDFRAVVMGEGGERGVLEDMSRRLGLDGRVHFMGAVSDVIPYLQHADAAVLCSDEEGFSNAVLEYMACGLPVVATAVGGNVELVDGSNGFLVPPGEAGDLAHALARLAGDPALREDLGARSRAKVEETYSWARCMEEWESYYKSVVNGVEPCLVSRSS